MVVVDDAHLAGPPLPDWLRFVRRENVAMAVVAAVRTGEGEALPATTFIHLDALGREAAAELVGPGRVDELYARSKGHPLFLTELAQQAAGAELPASLVDSVSARCDELGTAGLLLRTAAVIGPEVDADLLAAVLGRPVIELLDDAEQAVAKQFLVEQDGIFRFRHELVREALAASATAGRAALLHRQAGRVLDRRPGADPLTVAGHARLGGDLALAARALRDASAQAAERFDYAAAEALLDDALRLSPGPDGWLARSRIRTLRRRYAEALEDVERALQEAPPGRPRWRSARGRPTSAASSRRRPSSPRTARWPPKTRPPGPGAWPPAGGPGTPPATWPGPNCSSARRSPWPRARTGWTAAGWLGVLRAHQSRVDEALALLRPAARGQLGVEHTSATLHSLLFTGHAHALAGRPAQALAAFTRYTAEVERRQVPRFAGRAVNFAGWVLRNLGAWTEALDHHQEALEAGRGQGTTDVTIAALEDLAEQCLDTGDPDGAAARLAQAGALLHGDLVLGWRLQLKHRLYRRAAGPAARRRRTRARRGRRAGGRRDGARRAPVHQRRPAAGAPGQPRARPAVDPGAVAADLDLLDRCVAIEAWRWTCDVAADFAVPAWQDRAADRAARLAQGAGRYADGLLREADRRLGGRRTAAG